MELHINFVEGRVESLAQSDASVKAAGIESRYLIGADGLHSTVRHQLRMEIPNQKKIGNRYGIRQHFNVPPWSDLVEVYWLSDVEVYVTPVDPQTVGIAVLGKSTLNFKSIVERIPQLVEHLAAAEPSSKLRGAGPLRQRVRSQSVGRVLLVGDASGYIDALTGEGLRVGFAEAEAAVRAVCKDNPDAYRAEWKRVTRSYRWLTGGLLFAGSNRIIRPMIVPAAQALPRIYRRLIDTLA
jgi:flavin-dependent dehydrogenase